jgi:hypothetical protein
VNTFDYSLLLFFNHLADASPSLTAIVIEIYSTPLKTVCLVALLWWAWFDKEGQARQQEDRERIAACLVGSLLTIAGVRLLAAVLPFRVRPIANPDLFPSRCRHVGQLECFPQ